jgi:hypothetical protein
VPHIVLYVRAVYCAVCPCRISCCIYLTHIVLFIRAAYCAVCPCRILCCMSVPYIVLYFLDAYCTVYSCRVLCCMSVARIVLYFRAAYKPNPLSDSCFLMSNRTPRAVNTTDVKATDRIIDTRSTAARNQKQLC